MCDPHVMDTGAILVAPGGSGLPEACLPGPPVPAGVHLARGQAGPSLAGDVGLGGDGFAYQPFWDISEYFEPHLCGERGWVVGVGSAGQMFGWVFLNGRAFSTPNERIGS